MTWDPATPVPEGEVLVASYNVEALFDTEKDHEKQDHEYLPTGFYAWDEQKLTKKLENLSRVVRAMNGGLGPDLLALNEVENVRIATRFRDELLPDLGYDTLVHLDTECMYGLDNAILSRFPLLEPARLHAVNDFRTEASRRARDILEATFDVHGVPLTVFVNHWPAGEGRTAAQRLDIGKQLRAHVERKLRAEPFGAVMVMGDFNATRDEAAFGRRGLHASSDAERVIDPDASVILYDTRAPDSGEEAATHFTRPWPYTGPEGEWKAIDHIFVSAGLLDAREERGLTWVDGSTVVFRPPFLLAEDGTPRTFFERGVKPREQAIDRVGFSDHLPIVTRLRRTRRPG
ncbi:MAG: endonuclease/exonuclease/phosphatase family protein [Deltaproteobacteria bacterium]|nr:endonuclease/exonuclease/phosphatase family protein [Deltaproteobacteria bacterium]